MLENIPAIAIKDMQQFKGVYGVRVDEMVRAFVDDEVAMITGVVEKNKDPEEDSKIRVNGGAVYKQNKLVGFMNEDMIRMLLWRRGELRETMLTTQVQPKSKMYSGDVGIMMLRGNSRIKSKIVDGKPHFTIYFKGVAKIIENNTNLDMGDERNLEKTAEKFTQKFEKLMDELLHAAKNEWHVDILDLGKELHIHHTKYWQEHKAEWDELFPSVEVDYKFELTISRTGRMKIFATLLIREDHDENQPSAVVLDDRDHGARNDIVDDNDQQFASRAAGRLDLGCRRRVHRCAHRDHLDSARAALS